MIDNSHVATEPMSPDFYDYVPSPLMSVEQIGDFLLIRWADGMTLNCHRFWLRENTLGHGGIDLDTREGLMDPADLSDAMQIESFTVTNKGDLFILWNPDRVRSLYSSGWLRHIADRKHLPNSWIPSPEPWTVDSLKSLFRQEAPEILHMDDALGDLLNSLIKDGVCIVENVPQEEGFLSVFATRIGPIRDSNFGALWDVRADISLAGDSKTNTTANTSFRLGPHTDLPTREIPPGFQFLHCLISEANGGESTLTDGAALVAELKNSHPADYELLSTRHWIFFNRGPGIDHRWSAPIIDYCGGDGLPTIRAFYPVRAFPDRFDSGVAEAYQALRRFHRLADQPHLRLSLRLDPGQILCFDNRRILHGRQAFSGSGKRHLQGIYIDRDDVLSKARGLNRSRAAQKIRDVEKD